MKPTHETMQQVSEAIAPLLNDPRYAELITRDLASRGLLRQADAVEHSDWRGMARFSEVTVDAIDRAPLVKLTLVAGKDRHGLGLTPSQAERLGQLLLDGAAEARRIDPNAM